MATGDPLLDFALSLRSDLLTPVMQAVSEANSAAAYIVILPLVYWVFSRRVGIVLFAADAFSTFLVVSLKDGLALPRPPDVGESAWLARGEGYGFPSGHTAAASTTWGSIAASLGSARVAGLGAAIVCAVAFSRLYLGVHWSGDVAGGALIGVAFALAVLFGAKPAVERLARAPRSLRFALVLTFPALLLVNRSPDALMILCAASGAFAGHLVANERHVVLRTGDPRRLPLWGVLRLAFGLPVLGLLAVGLGSPSASEPLALAARFTVLGAFVTLLGPWLFGALESRVRPPPENGAALT
jgi:membrane-associated phospholipid phosphatase